MIRKDLTATAGTRNFVDLTMTYDSTYWSNPAKQGQPVLKADLISSPGVFCSLVGIENGSDVLDLSDSSSTQIEWIDVNAGKIRVHLDAATLLLSGLYAYEIRVKLADSSYVSVQGGQISFAGSVVGNK